MSELNKGWNERTTVFGTRWAVYIAKDGRVGIITESDDGDEWESCLEWEACLYDNLEDYEQGRGYTEKTYRDSKKQARAWVEERLTA